LKIFKKNQKKIRALREEIDEMLLLNKERLSQPIAGTLNTKQISFKSAPHYMICLIPKYSKSSPNFRQMAVHHVNSLKICEENIKPSFINYKSDIDKVLTNLRNILHRLKYRPLRSFTLSLYIFGIRDGERISNGKELGLVINELLNNIDYCCRGFQASPSYPLRVVLTGCNMQTFAGRMKNINVASIGDYKFDTTLTHKKHNLPLMLRVLKLHCDD